MVGSQELVVHIMRGLVSGPVRQAFAASQGMQLDKLDEFSTKGESIGAGLSCFMGSDLS